MQTPRYRDTFSIAEISAMSDLVYRIYADSITAETWGEILQLLGRLLNYKTIDAVRLSTSVPTEWAPITAERDETPRHTEYEPALIEMATRALECGLAVWRPADVIGEREWEESPLRAYLKMRGLGDVICISCPFGTEESTHFSIAREEIDEGFSDRDIFLLRHLQQHLTSAFRHRRITAAMEAAAETFRQIMRAGFICTASGSILEMNRFGRNIVEDPDKDPQAVRKLIEETARELIESGRNWSHIDILGDKGRLSVHRLALQTKPQRWAVVIDSYEYFRRVLRHRMMDVGLTAREIEICTLLVQGLPNRDIAGALFIAESTVKEHMTNILAKFGVSSRQGVLSALLGYERNSAD